MRRHGFATTFRGSRAAMLLGIILVMTVAGGCDLISSERDVTSFRITNQTDQIVDVVYINSAGPGGEDSVYQDLGAHSSVAITDKFRGDTCMSGPLIARDNSGNEVAKREGDICLPGEWIIEAPGPTGE